MSEVAQLLTAIAALVTAVGGATATILVAIGGLRRSRSNAATEATRLAVEHHTSGGKHRARRISHHDPAELDRHARELSRNAADLARDARLENQLEQVDQQHHDPGRGGHG